MAAAYHNSDACPNAIDGCTIDQIYNLAYARCTTTHTLDSARDCLDARVAAMITYMWRGFPYDAGHGYAIRLAGAYFAHCLSSEMTMDAAMRFVRQRIADAFSGAGLAMPPDLAALTRGNDAMTESCRRGQAAAIAALDADLDTYMGTGGGKGQKSSKPRRRRRN